MAQPRQLLSTRSLTRIKNIVGDLTRDSSISNHVTVKYRKFDESKLDDFDPESQSISSVYTDYGEVDALKGNFSDREVFLGGGDLEIGDVRFLVYKELVSGIPRNKDVLVESGVTYGVINVWTDPLDLSFVFHCRRG
ncbi:MAG: hypothetical protein ABID54_00180 [Pseudomonadota bacterium]